MTEKTTFSYCFTLANCSVNEIYMKSKTLAKLWKSPDEITLLISLARWFRKRNGRLLVVTSKEKCEAIITLHLKLATRNIGALLIVFIKGWGVSYRNGANSAEFAEQAVPFGQQPCDKNGSNGSNRNIKDRLKFCSKYKNGEQMTGATYFL